LCIYYLILIIIIAETVSATTVIKV